MCFYVKLKKIVKQYKFTYIFFCGKAFIGGYRFFLTVRVAACPASSSYFLSNSTSIGNATASFVINFLTLNPEERSAAL